MAQQILEGTWKEVSERAHELPEEQPVRLTILTIEEALPARPNEAMLEALRKVSERNKGKALTSGEDTERLLREARDGGMYGIKPTITD